MDKEIPICVTLTDEVKSKWEYKALKYANDHKHGISALIIKDIYYDKIWTKEFNDEN